MGALHEGHLSLVKKAKSENDLAIASIYVNQRQFNDPEDFKKYPRDSQRDIHLLEQAGCDVLFLPQTPEEVEKVDLRSNLSFALNGLDHVLEGQHRPGHFKAVIEVVLRLFTITKPSKAYFGLKDFQQYRIIKYFSQQNSLDVEVVGVPTVRESDGLALSSRNQRLSPAEHEVAHGILRTLEKLRVDYHAKKASVSKLKEDYIKELKALEGVKNVDYLEIADEDDLQSIEEYKEVGARAFVALHLGKVRLIDNISLNP